MIPSGFFAFRTPLLPFGVLAGWSEGLLAPTAGADLEVALAHDYALLEGRLRALVVDPVVREALFVASPSLDDAIEAWLEDPAGPRARGVLPIVTRYLSRMCARCTPFGLFSGCSVARLGEVARLEVVPRASYVRHTRLDTHYLTALCHELLAIPALRRVDGLSPELPSFPVRRAGPLRPRAHES